MNAVESSQIFRFRLFVAGDAPNSTMAIANLTVLCEERLGERYEIELVDVLREPMRALDDGIFLTPTLVKLAPGPMRRVVGTLSQTQVVTQALGLDSAQP